MERVVVAFSGGADSALVAHVATEVLGTEGALCVTAVSASLAPEELADCRALAEEWGLRWRGGGDRRARRPDYVANGADRCYHCKASLLSALTPLARAEGAVVVLGVNLDDLGDHRPGQVAAAERGARFPVGLGRAHQRRRAGRVAPARTTDVGQARRGLPGVAPALRHAGDPRHAERRWRPPSRRYERSGSVNCGSATTATWLVSSSTSTTSWARCNGATTSSPPCRRRDTAT